MAIKKGEFEDFDALFQDDAEEAPEDNLENTDDADEGNNAEDEPEDNDETPEDDQDEDLDPDADDETPPAETPAEEAPVAPPVVPASVVKKLRDDKRALQAQLQQLRQQYDPAFQAPDPTDPGYATWQANNEAMIRINATLDTSERYARKTHGEEKIDAVKEWFETLCATDPQRGAEILNSEDPYEEAIAEYDKTRVDEDELAEFRAWKAAGKTGTPASPPAPPKKAPVPPSQFKLKTPAPKPAPRQAPPPPPQGLSSIPNSGGKKSGKGEAIGSQAAFDDTFKT